MIRKLDPASKSSGTRFSKHPRQWCGTDISRPVALYKEHGVPFPFVLPRRSWQPAGTDERSDLRSVLIDSIKGIKLLALTLCRCSLAALFALEKPPSENPASLERTTNHFVMSHFTRPTDPSSEQSHGLC